MKLYDDMSETDRRHYMDLMAKATGSVMPLDACFLLVVMSKTKGKASYCSSIERRCMPGLLREYADQIEQDMREGN